MQRPRRRNPVAVALYLNAGLLGATLVALLMRGGGISLTAPVFGAPQANPPAIGASGSLILMPAQFSSNTWGCYVLDAEKRTLCGYQYYPGLNQLRMVAARQFTQDLDLKNWNTTPDIREVQRLIDLERNAVRGRGQGPQPQDLTPPDRPGPIEPAGPTTKPAEPKDPTKDPARNDGPPPEVEPVPGRPAGAGPAPRESTKEIEPAPPGERPEPG